MAGINASGSYALNFISFDQINPNNCPAFADTYSLDCLSCNAGTFLDDGSCVATCPLGKYPNSSTWTCDSCHSNCQGCTGAGSTNCSSCDTGRFFEGTSCPTSCVATNVFENTATNTCDSCHAECATCSGPSNSQCLSCSGVRYLEGA